MASGSAAVGLLETLAARGDTLAGLERLLQLSPGYLSKVRCGRVTPSQQLAALLGVLVKHPEVRTTLISSGGLEPGEAPVPAGEGVSQSAFLSRLTAAWTARQVRFHGVDDLLLRALGVRPPRGLDPSLRFLVHPDDRHALAEARVLQATVAMASSHAAMCTPLGSDVSIVVVFPLSPLYHLFDKVRLSAVDAALYFALQAGEEAEKRLRAVAKKHTLGRVRLQRAFAKTYGDAAPLPAREWLLRAMFDPDGARRRLARLP